MTEFVACVGNKEITLIKQALPFNNAKSSCEARGQVLGAITTLEEHEFLVSLAERLQEPNGNIWIGEYSYLFASLMCYSYLKDWKM